MRKDRGAKWNLFSVVLGVGVVLFLIGGAGDLAHHLVPHEWGWRLPFGHDGSAAHMITVAGMVLSVVGLLGAPLAGRANASQNSSEKG